VISKKAIIAGVFSAIVGVGMLAMPASALAHDWDHNGNGWHHEHHDSGRNNNWFRHDDNHNNGWFDHRRAEQQQQARGYYQPPNYGYGYQQPRYPYGNPPPRYGYNYQTPGYGYGYQQPGYEGYGTRQYGIPSNGNGMVSERHPGLAWTCDSDGHHCHWAARGSSSYGYPQTGLGSIFGNNSGYGNNGYYGNNRYSNNGYYGNNAYGNGYNGNGYNGINSYGMNSPLGGLGSFLGPMFGGQRP
jgi:hypothetical protein